VKSFS